MAETLKFGGGIWATKEGSTLAYNSENGNFKPLPFTFDRSTSATRVNKQGLIEVVPNNEPRIDFLNDSKGALLLEPSRSNLYTYSEDFSNSNWSKDAVSINANQIVSPSGSVFSDEIIENSSTTEHSVRQLKSITSGNYYTISVFVKNSSNKRDIYIRCGDANILVYFDTTNWTVGDEVEGSGKIENYGNGWYRLIATGLASSTGADNFRFGLSNGTTNGSQNYTGNGVNSMYFYGAQLEQGSYATSYIPTQGSIGTRVAESSLQGGFQDKNIFGSTQGTALFEFVWDELNYIFNFNVGGVEVIRIFNDNYTQWRIRDTISSTWYYTGFTATKGQKTKIALRWSGTEIIAFQNGVKSTNVGTLGSNIAVESITQNNLNNTSNIQFYNTALTDQELIALTS